MRARPVLKVLAKAAIAVACVLLAALMLTLITLVQLVSFGFTLTILKVTFVFALACLLLHAFTGRALDAALISVPAFLIAVSVAIASGALSLTTVSITAGSQLRAGTRQEVLDFLAEDDTDALPYIPNVFVCKDFAQRLQERAHERGLSCWMIFIYPKSGPYGHVVNAFPLAEGSIIYVEPQNDTVSENVLTFFRWCTWDNTFEVVIHDDFGREIGYYIENVRW
jgi:hypothetical protein